MAGLNDSRHQGDHSSSSFNSSPISVVPEEAWHAWRVCKLMSSLFSVFCSVRLAVYAISSGLERDQYATSRGLPGNSHRHVYKDRGGTLEPRQISRTPNRRSTRHIIQPDLLRSSSPRTRDLVPFLAPRLYDSIPFVSQEKRHPPPPLLRLAIT